MNTIRKISLLQSASGLVFRLSDETPDSYFDIIRVRGWEWNNFLKNPACLVNHQSDFLFGRWKPPFIQNNALYAELVPPPRGVSARHDEYLSLIDAGILRAVSVGFRPIESRPRQNSKNGGIEYTRQELVEASICAVGANPNAILEAKRLGVSTETIRKMFGEQAALAKNSQAGQIRQARRIIRNAKGHLERAVTSRERAAYEKTIRVMEAHESRLRAELDSGATRTPAQINAEHAQAVRARAAAVLARSDERIAREIEQSASGQAAARDQQTIAAFDATNRILQSRAAPEPEISRFRSSEQTVKWRGQTIPVNSTKVGWRGK